MIKFLIKGLLRDKSRSLFPVLTVSAGVFLTVFFYAFLMGVFSDYLVTSAKYDTGHVKITTRAYKELEEQLPNDLALTGTGNILKTLKEKYPDMLWIERIRFGGLLDVPDKNGETKAQGPVMGIGIDLLSQKSPEYSILKLNDILKDGRIPEKSREILMSEEFAKKLQINIGDTVTFIGSTMFGSMAIYNFKVSGIVRFGPAVLNRGTIIADLSDVRVALDMEDAASEILGYSPDMLYREKEMIELSNNYNNIWRKENDDFSPVMMALTQQPGLRDYVEMAKAFSFVLLLIFIIAMSVVLWNSGLLNGLRRYGEIGIRLAMGEDKNLIYLRTIVEAVVIGIIGSVIGTLLGLAISYYLQFAGWNFGEMMKKSNLMLPDELRTRVTITCYFIGFIPGVFSSVLGTCFAGIGIYKRQTSQLFKELEV